jgi:hypothetical protein
MKTILPVKTKGIMRLLILYLFLMDSFDNRYRVVTIWLFKLCQYAKRCRNIYLKTTNDRDVILVQSGKESISCNSDSIARYTGGQTEYIGT